MQILEELVVALLDELQVGLHLHVGLLQELLQPLVNHLVTLLILEGVLHGELQYENVLKTTFLDEKNCLF